MFRPSLAILFALAIATGSVPAQTSPTNLQYNLSNQHTYAFTPIVVGWEEARTFARSLGGYLVAINDPAEQAYITAVYGSGTFNDSCWIGLNDVAQEGTFVWDSGEPVTFTNWCAGEPNNFGGDEDYVEIFPGFAGGPSCWNDIQSPYTGPSFPPAKGIVELAFGTRVDFDGASTSCEVSPFPISNGFPADPEGVSWNGVGPAGTPRATVTTVVEDGFPVTGNKYLRMIAEGSSNVAPGGPLPRPAAPELNEIRIQIPPGTKGVSLAYELITTEQLPFNDGIDISVIDVNGNRVALVAYADVTSSFGGSPFTGAYCFPVAGASLLPAGPQTASRYLPVLPYPAYLSIVCWNGSDNAFASAAHVDAIQFWGGGKFELKMSAPNGAGSLRFQNVNGTAFAPYWTAVTLAPGAFPNGWLFGLDISLNDLLTQVSFGAPFSGSLNGSGNSSYVLPAGIPPGVALYAVSLQFGTEVMASAPETFVTF